MIQENHSQARPKPKLSYKFQRLREKLRAAILSGELNGKLPGERQLARRFHVNAKTLSKALTDLMAEGLLERRIGRGTFVKGSLAPPSAPARWLVVCDQDQLNSAVVEHLRQINGNLQVITDTSELRPSFLNPFKAAIILSPHFPDESLKDLLVRNIVVVLVGHEPMCYSVNAVLVDRSLGAAYLAREMMLKGHRRFVAVERRGQTAVVQAIRSTAQRYAPDATVDSIYPQDVLVAVEQHGASAIICDSRRGAAQVRQLLQDRGLAVPAQVSLGAVGSGQSDFPCNGYFVHPQQKAQAVVQLIQQAQLKRPTALWLTGTYVDMGTIAPPVQQTLPAAQIEQPRPPLPFAELG